MTATKDGKKAKSKTYVKEFNALIDEMDPMNKDIISLNWNMYQVQKVLGNKRSAKEHLENAYLEIKSRSKNIKEKANRNKYLSIKLHNDITTAWNN